MAPRPHGARSLDSESHAVCLPLQVMSPTDWTPAYRGGAPVPAALAASRPPAAEGTIVRAEGPILAPVRSGPWKFLSVLGLVLLLLPWLLGLVLLVLAFSFVLRLLFHRPPHHGSGLFTEIFVFHILGSLFQPRRTAPVYHYVLQTPRGQLAVRQEGELATGRIFVGNHVSLHGRWHRGELVLRDGENLTLRTDLRVRGEGWRSVFPWIAGACLLQYAYLLTLS